MAATQGVTLDTVTIEIEGSAKSASESITALSLQLGLLKESIRGGFSGLNKLNAYLSELPNTINKITPETLENLGKVSIELSTKLEPLATKLQSIADGFKAISDLSRYYGSSIKEIIRSHDNASNSGNRLSVTLKKIKSALQPISAGFKTVFTSGTTMLRALEKPLKKTTSTIKQMGMALLSVRSIFTLTRKAINEYLQMDTELQKSAQNTWRALGAQLAPALEYTYYLFHQFVRVIYSVILALTGIDLISRANEKAMKGWGKAAKDTLGNLQKFDDLNVVKFPESSSGDDNTLIDMEKIDLSPIIKILEWVKRLKKEIKEALDTGDWKLVGNVFGEGIDAALKSIFQFIPKLELKMKNFAKDFANFINGSFEKIDASNILNIFLLMRTRLKEFITEFVANLNGEVVGQKLSDAIVNFDYKRWINGFVNLWVTIGKKLIEILSNIDFNALGLKIGEAIRNINWKEIWSTVFGLLKEVLSGLVDFVAGLFNIDTKGWSKFSKILIGIEGILLAIGGFALVKMLLSNKASEGLGGVTKATKDIGKGLKNMFSGLGKAAEIIAILGGLALVISQITNLIKVFGDSGVSVKDAGILIGVAFASIAAGFIALALASKLLDVGKVLGITLILGSLSLVLYEVSQLFSTFSKTGMQVNDVFSLMMGIVAPLIVLITGLTIAANLLSSPMAMAGLLVLTVALAGILFTLANTLPTILEACGKFIETVAPPMIQVLDSIFGGIEKIIKAIGETLPPIIDSIGNMFYNIFKGIGGVIESIGNTITKVLESIGKLVDNVLNSILNFINRLGPAVNNFVDNMIKAVTKLINFLISGIEFMINTLIINSVNGLVNKLNKLIPGSSFDLNTLGKVKIDRFAPKLSTGTNEIPYEGIYHLHPGEAVVPKKYNPALGNGTNAETNERLDTLIGIMENMSFTNVVNVGNKTLYKEQQRYNKMQNNKYGNISI